MVLFPQPAGPKTAHSILGSEANLSTSSIAAIFDAVVFQYYVIAYEAARV